MGSLKHYKEFFFPFYFIFVFHIFDNHWWLQKFCTDNFSSNCSFFCAISIQLLYLLIYFEVGPGHFPPPRHRHSFSEDHDHWDTDSHYMKHYNPQAVARAKGVGKPNRLGQVIPVYGFGIFLYIIYLFFKVSLVRSYLEICSVQHLSCINNFTLGKYLTGALIYTESWA